MQRFMISAMMMMVFAGTAAAQIGKSVAVAAGTPEDKALTEIYAAPDGPAKIALLDKFMTDSGKGDMELLGDQLYLQTYLAQKNYAKVYEYGDKVLQLDPDNFAAAVSIIHAADEQGDTKRVFDEGEKSAAILAHYKASAAPEGMPPDQWAARQQEALKNAEADIGYVGYAMVNVGYKTSDPAARAALFERFAAAFPDSSYTLTVREQTAIAYQQAHDMPKMLAAAQSVLASDPNNISMLLLLADTWCNDPHHMEEAATDAQKALDLLAQAKKPENVTDDQWQKQVSLQKGLAYSSLGEVYVNKSKNPQAVDAFKQATPLLKSDNFSYAQNQYRLGFTLAKMQRIPEARTVLSEVVAMDSPYKQTAMETLKKIGGPVSAKPAGHKSS